ncbi:unnamed protein product [Caenorhabditis nigoni]
MTAKSLLHYHIEKASCVTKTISLIKNKNLNKTMKISLQADVLKIPDTSAYEPTVTASEQSWSDRRIQVTLRADAFELEQIDNPGVVVQNYKNIPSIGKIVDCPGAFVVDVGEHRRREYHIKASENLAILLASRYMGIYQGHLNMGVPYQGIRESCDSSGIQIYGDISRASEYGSTISRQQRILQFFWHPDIWGYIKGILIWEYHIKASENLAILLASRWHLNMGIPYQGIRESCNSSGIQIYGDISRASEYGNTISRHQRILQFFWHPDIWGYIKGIWIWEYYIEASENLAILLASRYMGIYQGHLNMGIPYQGIRESCNSSGIQIYGDISRASEYGSTISRHQRILQFFWHPDIWGYIMGIWIWEYHIKASENLAILLASRYMGIYQGHLNMGIPYQGIRESCDSSGIQIYGDISRASEYGNTISRHQRILQFFWHPDIWGYIMGIWIWEYHIKASENLAILLASRYMGIYQGHLNMGIPYQGIRESCNSSGIQIYGDISRASEYGNTISRHQRILQFFWHPDIYHGHQGVLRHPGQRGGSGRNE